MLTRHLGTRLFDVRASEPAILAAVTAVLMGVALLACDIPARRAGRVGASVALRGE
ncbi:MAG: hypothetical protein H0X67_17085 [Acidobacteria bacterium]|nr:hypothetical protein [Acidobacteriota bacterium]